MTHAQRDDRYDVVIVGGGAAMQPAELLAIGREEVEGYGVDLIGGSVRTVVPTATGLTVERDDGEPLRARRVLVTTGVSDALPAIPGVRERWGRDLLHCPYCHGWEVRDQPLGVLGTHPGAVLHALLVRQWSGSPRSAWTSTPTASRSSTATVARAHPACGPRATSSTLAAR